MQCSYSEIGKASSTREVNTESEFKNSVDEEEEDVEDIYSDPEPPETSSRSGAEPEKPTQQLPGQTKNAISEQPRKEEEQNSTLQ